MSGLARKLKRSVPRLARCRVLVVGDLMLDQYVVGDVDRISPEAPVPVVQVRRDEAVLGGAANVAANMASLGAEVAVLGLVGKDPAARRLRGMLAEAGIDTAHVVTDAARPTTKKTRVVAGHQQVVRVDRESRAEPAARLAGRLDRLLARLAPEYDAVLVSDYGKGMVRARLLDALRAARQVHGFPVVVDPKDIHFSNYRGFSLATPNLAEASLAAGCKLRDQAEVVSAGKRLRAEVDLEHLLITRGPQGMSLFSEGEVEHIPTMAREVFDVSGAGDTVAALMTLGLAAGLSAGHAAHLANAAAAVVVGKMGTAVIDAAGLRESLERLEN